MVERFNHSFPVQHSRPGFRRTLEIGAGLGEHLNHERLSAEQRAAYSVVEMRTNMVEQLRARHPSISVVVGDCQGYLPFPDNHFDRYLAIHVLEHLPDLPSCIRQAWRLLDKERGQLLVVIPCEGGLAYSLARRASAQPIFERTYRMPYRPIIEHEHINRPHEIIAELKPYFTLETQCFFPVRALPVVSANLCLGIALRPRPTLGRLHGGDGALRRSGADGALRAEGRLKTEKAAGTASLPRPGLATARQNAAAALDQRHADRDVASMQRSPAP